MGVLLSNVDAGVGGIVGTTSILAFKTPAVAIGAAVDVLLYVSCNVCRPTAKFTAGCIVCVLVMFAFNAVVVHALRLKPLSSCAVFTIVPVAPPFRLFIVAGICILPVLRRVTVLTPGRVVPCVQFGNTHTPSINVAPVTLSIVNSRVATVRVAALEFTDPMEFVATARNWCVLIAVVMFGIESVVLVIPVAPG